MSAVLSDFDKHVSEGFSVFRLLKKQTTNNMMMFCHFGAPVFETSSMFCGDSFAICSEKCGVCVGMSPSIDRRSECLGGQNLSIGGKPVKSLDDPCVRFPSECFGIIGDSSTCESEDFHDGIICDSSMSVRVFRTHQSTFLN